MHLCARPTWTDFKNADGGLMRHLIGAIGPGPESECLCEEASRGFEAAHREANCVEAVNRHLDGYRASLPGSTLYFARVVYKFKALPFGIAERKHEASFRAACLYAVMGDVEIIETLGPPGARVLSGDAQRDGRDAACARTIGANICPFKKGQVGTWATKLIAIEEVIGRSIVLVHRFFG